MLSLPLVLQLPMMAPSSHREQRHNRQRSEAKPCIVQCRPRQDHQHGETAHRQPQPLHSKSWCTGEDSNLRSPLGAADLQSAAINHSATCAHRAEQIVRPGTASPAIKEPLTSFVSHLQDSPTAARYGVRAKSILGSCCWGQFSRRILRPTWLAPAATRSARSCLRIWSWRRDLNPRPSDYKSDALPAELRQRTTLMGACPNQA